MHDQWRIVPSAVLAIFAVVAIGGLSRRLNWLTEAADRSLLKLVVNVLLPAFIFDRILGNAILRQPSNILLPPLVGFFTVVAGFAIGWLVARSLRRHAGLDDPVQQRTFALCVGLYNYGYVPLPLAELLFGQNTVAVLFVHNLGVEVCLWTVAMVLIGGHLGGQWYKRLLNGPSIAIVAALALNYFNLPSYLNPSVNSTLHQALKMLGDATIPLAVLLIGATIADDLHQARFAQGGRVIALASFLRLGLLPVGFIALAYFLPASRELKNVIILQAAMPSAVFTILLARHFGGHPATAIRIVVATSILSLLTIPLWLSAGLWLLTRIAH